MKGSIHIDGFEIEYDIHGSGHPVMIIGSAVYYPRTFPKPVENQLQCIYLDHRGFAKTNARYTNQDFSIEKIIDDIEIVRQKLGLKKFAILGHSGHAYFALEYAKKYPEQVTHIILAATSPDGSEASIKAADQYFEESVCPERKALYAQKMRTLASAIEADPSRRFVLYSLHSAPRIWYDPTFDASALWDGVHINAEMFDYVWGQLFKTINIKQGLNQLKQPVLLMLGRYDYWNPPHLWEPMRNCFNDLTIRVFEKSGHTPQLEEPDQFSRELIEWLARHHELMYPNEIL